MTPERLLVMLGTGANVSAPRLRLVCEAFNREVKEMIREHERRCHAHRAYRQAEPELGTPEWARLRAN